MEPSVVHQDLVFHFVSGVKPSHGEITSGISALLPLKGIDIKLTRADPSALGTRLAGNSSCCPEAASVFALASALLSKSRLSSSLINLIES